MSESATIEAPTHLEPGSQFGQELAAAMQKAQAEKAAPEQREEVQQLETEKAPEAERPEKKERKTRTVPKLDTANPLASLMEDEPEQDVEAAEADADIDAKVDADFADPKAAGAWGKLKGELKAERNRAAQYNRSLAQLKQELETAKAAPQSGGKDFEDLKAQYEDLRKELPIQALERDPDFKANVLEPLQSAYNFLQEVSEQFNIPETKIREIFQATKRSEENKLADALFVDTDADSYTKQDFRRAIDDIRALSAKRKEGYDKANELLASNQSKAGELTAAQQQKRNAELDLAATAIFEKISKSRGISELVTDDVKQSALAYLKGKQTPTMQAYSAAAGYVLPHLQKQYLDAQAEIAELKETLKRYSKGSPAAGGGGEAKAGAGEQRTYRLDEAGSGIAEGILARRGH